MCQYSHSTRTVHSFSLSEYNNTGGKSLYCVISYQCDVTLQCKKSFSDIFFINHIAVRIILKTKIRTDLLKICLGTLINTLHRVGPELILIHK